MKPCRPQLCCQLCFIPLNDSVFVSNLQDKLRLELEDQGRMVFSDVVTPAREAKESEVEFGGGSSSSAMCSSSAVSLSLLGKRWGGMFVG